MKVVEGHVSYKSFKTFFFKNFSRCNSSKSRSEVCGVSEEQVVVRVAGLHDCIFFRLNIIKCNLKILIICFEFLY